MQSDLAIWAEWVNNLIILFLRDFFFFFLNRFSVFKAPSLQFNFYTVL